jgi:hypothetical protein
MLIGTEDRDGLRGEAVGSADQRTCTSGWALLGA